jgi:hypothetical protein
LAAANIDITAPVSELSALTVSGGSGDNVFAISGAGANVMAIVNTGTGDDVTTVQATQLGDPFAIHGQNGTDTVTVGSAGSVQGIVAPVSVDNAGGATTLTLDDSADTTARTVTVAPTSVIGLAASAIAYLNVTTLTLKGGGPSDSFTVTPSPSTTDSLVGGGSASTPAPGNTLTMTLAGSTSPALTGIPASQGAQGAWTFANRSPVDFSRMATLNPTALSISDAAATVGGSGSSPLNFTASLLAPSTQVVSASYATADASATAASGAYQPASGTVVFAPGTTSQTISVDALGSPTVRPVQTFLLNLTTPVGAVFARVAGTGTITDSYVAPPPPTVAHASQSHRTWREGNAAARISAANAQPPLGTTFSFTLNEQASVSFAFTQPAAGRKIDGKCIAQTKSNRHKPACHHAVTRGTLAFAGHTATNKVSFEGRISNSKKLKPGRYTLLITATNIARQHSPAQPLSFTIVK